MAVSNKPSSFKKATNVSLSVSLIAEAKELDINVSQACERGLTSEIARMRAIRWLAANAESIASSNAFVEREGLPLASKRLF